MDRSRLHRIALALKAEFHEMPGLQLTEAQVRRLYSLDAQSCDQVLGQLVNEHFLFLTSGHRFCRVDESSAATR
jgi:hypothetical protein